MLAGNRILAIVPARGGSKGIPLKNLRKLAGVSLVARVGEVLRDLPWIDRAVVSTDHEEIAAAAEASGISSPFRRPASLSGDLIGDVDVLTHALLETERLDGVQYDLVLMLQPTSPLRKATEVEATVKHLVDGEYDSVWTISETDSKAHPAKQLRFEDGQLNYYDPRGAEVIARQQLSRLYHRNGVAYVLTRRCLLEQKSLKGHRCGALLLERHHVSIDTEWDLQYAEFVLARTRCGPVGGTEGSPEVS